MKLNWLGRAAMNSRARAIAQGYVASLLDRMGGKLDGGAALEIGCGGGLGAEIILDRFAAESVLAIDLDFAMLATARRRLARRGREAVRLAQANAVALPAGDATFDAVFDFGAIHLEPEWRRALTEVARVLEPGGRYYFEVVASRALRIAYPLLSAGFGSMEPPAVDSFLGQLARVGIDVGTRFVRPRLAAVSGWVGDLVGVGVRAGTPSAGRIGTEQLEESSGCT